MNTQNIYDNKNNIAGRLVEQDNVIRLMDKSNNYVGMYNKDNNLTFDRTGKRIASGNVLTNLLNKLN